MSLAHYAIKRKINTYMEVQAAWEKAYKNFQSELPPGNQLGLIFPDSSQEAVREFFILGHECQVRLSPCVIESSMFGKLEFERMTSQDKGKAVLVLYMDDLGNVGQGPENLLWHFGQPQSLDFDRFGIVLADAFFSSYNEQ